MRLKRSYIAIIAAIIALLVIFAFVLQQGPAPAIPVPKTRLTGTVSSVQPNSNFTIIIFTDLATRLSYGTAITNSTGGTHLCNTQGKPCTYSISLYPNDSYNATIQVVISTSIGPLAQDCAAVHLPDGANRFTPTGTTETADFQCNTNYPTA